jgi:hypothetical protein
MVPSWYCVRLSRCWGNVVIDALVFYSFINKHLCCGWVVAPSLSTKIKQKRDSDSITENSASIRQEIDITTQHCT